MSRIALLVLMLCVSKSSLAQIKVSMLSLKDTSVAELYLNAENKVGIDGLKNGDKVALAGKPVQRLDSDVYILSPAYTADSVLTVKNRNNIIFSKVFTVRKFPDVAVRLDTIHGAYATIAEVLANPNLVVETGNLKGWISLVAFDLGIKSGQAYEATPTMLGTRLSVYQTDLIKQFKPGDKLLFENIRATCPTCDIRTLRPFTIIIQ